MGKNSKEAYCDYDKIINRNDFIHTAWKGGNGMREHLFREYGEDLLEMKVENGMLVASNTF